MSSSVEGSGNRDSEEEPPIANFTITTFLCSTGEDENVLELKGEQGHQSMAHSCGGGDIEQNWNLGAIKSTVITFRLI